MRIAGIGGVGRNRRSLGAAVVGELCHCVTVIQLAVGGVYSEGCVGVRLGDVRENVGLVGHARARDAYRRVARILHHDLHVNAGLLVGVTCQSLDNCAADLDGEGSRRQSAVYIPGRVSRELEGAVVSNVVEYSVEVKVAAR